jgi:hypothetical protein
LVERWFVAPKAVGSSPSSYPMSIFLFFFNYNFIIFNIQSVFLGLIKNFFTKFFFLLNYYILNELIWQEGFLVDFIQKKMTDNWIKKFLVYSSYLFNERLVFDKVVKFYLNLIIWPLHKLFIFEINNVANILFITVFLFFFFFLFFSFLFFFFLFFSV